MATAAILAGSQKAKVGREIVGSRREAGCMRSIEGEVTFDIAVVRFPGSGQELLSVPGAGLSIWVQPSGSFYF